MAGVILLTLVMLVVAPMALFVGGAAWSALLGAALDADRRAAAPTEG